VNAVSDEKLQPQEVEKNDEKANPELQETQDNKVSKVFLNSNALINVSVLGWLNRSRIKKRKRKLWQS